MNRIYRLATIILPALGYFLLGGAAITYSPPALAVNGQCKWENGPGAPTHAYCEYEDCTESGGLAICSQPKLAPSSAFGDAYTDSEQFIYGMCDMGPPHMAKIARWCHVEGGIWHGPYAPVQCEGVPNSQYPGVGSASSEGAADAASDQWMEMGYSPDCTVTPNDSGWGFPNAGDQFCGGNQTFQNSMVITDVKRRQYQVSCPGQPVTNPEIKVTKGRRLICPGSHSRTKPNGDLQCFIPMGCCVEGNPVNVITGAKLQEERDYTAADGLNFIRYYSSANQYRTPATGAFLSQSTDYWRHSFSRKVIPVSGNAFVAAVVQSDDGAVRQFSPSGQELHNVSGGASRFEALPGGGWKLTNPSASTEFYDANGRFVSALYPNGLEVSVSRDISGRISSLSNSFGRSISLDYNPNGSLASLTIPGGGLVTYAYDDRGRLSGVTYPDSTSKTYHYESPINSWLLTGITDETGTRFATYQYDDYGRVVSEEHAGGADKRTFSYGNSRDTQMYTQIGDPLGKTRAYTLNNTRGVFKLRSSAEYCPTCENLSAATFDANGNYSSKTDLNSRRTNYVYDLTRNLETSRTEGLTAYGNATAVSRTITTEWHSTHRLPTLIRVFSGATATGTPLQTLALTYDAAGNALTRTFSDPVQGLSRTWSYTYGSFGKVLTEDGPRTDINDTTVYSYYECASGGECGRLHTITNALGHTTTYNTYNAHGQPLLVTDPNGVQTMYSYDGRRRLISQTVAYGTPSAEQSTFEYWANGLVKKVVDPDGSYILHTYDNAQRLMRVEDGAGNKEEYILDADGNVQVTNAFDPFGTLVRTQRQLYNSLGQLWQVLSAAGTDNEAIVYSYDQNGNQTSMAEPLGRVTTNTYDELNRLKQIIDPAGGVITYAYNFLDELTQVNDPRGLTTAYQYNGLGELKQLTSPDTGTSTFDYDSGGNLKTTVNSRGATTALTFDALNRPVTTAFSISGSTDQSITYTYDAGSNAKGRLSSVADANHSIAWSYDLLGRVTNKTQTVGGVSKSVIYSYVSGQLAGLLTPSGQSIAYQFDSIGRPSGISVNGSSLLGNITYDAFGPVTGWTWGNGTLTIRNYDLDGRPDLIDSAGMSVFQFNADGSIASRLDDQNNSYLLAPGQTNVNVASGSNKVTATTGLLQRSYTYDAAGNVVSDGSATFTYNFANRMSSATKNGVTATYTYNALGQRIRKSVGSATTYFVYDEGGHLLGQYDGSGALIEEFVWLGDVPVATVRPAGSGSVAIYYIHTDHLDTPRRVTRPADNQIVWRWDSDPFGEAPANPDPDGDSQSFVFSLRFPGQFKDPETDLNYNYFRDYDSALGRYVQSDPIGLRGGLNTYAYAGGNPLSFYDPNGLEAAPAFPHSPVIKPPAPGGFVSSPAARGIMGTAAGIGLADSPLPGPADLAALSYILWQWCKPDCGEVTGDLYKAMQEFDRRKEELLTDRCGQYHFARTQENPKYADPGCRGSSWEGHRKAIQQVKNRLANLLRTALRNNCYIPPGVMERIISRIPDYPRGWFPGRKPPEITFLP